MATIGKLVSSRATDWPLSSIYGTTYQLGKYVKPRVKGTRLFAFSTLKSAQKFAEGCYLDEVYEATGRDVRAFPYYAASINEVNKFWRVLKNHNFRVTKTSKHKLAKSPHNDVVIAKEIRLDKRIQ